MAPAFETSEQHTHLDPTPENAALDPRTPTTVTPSAEQYTALQQAMDFFNHVLFEGRLRPCMVTLSRKRDMAGYYYAEPLVRREGGGKTTDEIGLHPGFITGHSIEEVLAVLVSRMTLQWCRQLGEEPKAGYYSRRWAEKMKGIGLQPSKTGKPGGDEVGYGINHYILAGGKFLRACRDLIDGGFSLPWMDRVVPDDELFGLPPLEEVATQLLDSSAPAPALPDSTDGATKTKWESTPTRDTDSFAGDAETSKPNHAEIFQPARASTEELARMGVVIDTGQKKQRSGVKTTYECPRHHAKVWGKAGLHIVCGVCQSVMVDPSPRASASNEQSTPTGHPLKE